MLCVLKQYSNEIYKGSDVFIICFSCIKIGSTLQGLLFIACDIPSIFMQCYRVEETDGDLIARAEPFVEN